MDLKNEPLIIKFCPLPTKLQAAQKYFISEFTLSTKIVFCTRLYFFLLSFPLRAIKRLIYPIQQCPNGWYRILDSCIWLSQEKLNYEDANTRCGELVANGRLFEPMNLLQNNLVKQLAQTLVETSESLNEYHIWVGIDDKLVEGE